MPFHPVERALAEARQFARALALALTGGSWARAIFRIALLTGTAIAVAVLYAWTGFFSLSASSGHSALTYWFLDFGKRNVVETMSTGIDPPSLDPPFLNDPLLVMKGAGHYAGGCESCHGAPGKPRSLITQRMSPEPPPLPAKLHRWNDAELFWIVKHGIKFTGMPAWPSIQRDDEVWAMVSFLRAMQEMNARDYEHLAYGGRVAADGRPVKLPMEDESLAAVIADCARCHGRDGMGRGAGAFPRLAQQQEDYLFESLRAFATGARASGMMQAVATTLDATTMRALARHYASLPLGATNDAVHADVERGRDIANGVAERGIPACVHCHGPSGEERNPLYPQLAGQHAAYIELQLRLFKDGQRGGTEYAGIMHAVTRRMTPEDMRALADYYASLRPEAE